MKGLYQRLVKARRERDSELNRKYNNVWNVVCNSMLDFYISPYITKLLKRIDKGEYITKDVICSEVTQLIKEPLKQTLNNDVLAKYQSVIANTADYVIDCAYHESGKIIK